MFSDRSASEDGGVDLPSFWKKDREVREGGCQTEPSHTREEDTQTKDFCHVDTQTADTASGNDAAPADDMEAVAEFLRSASILVEEELEVAANSRAWDGYKGLLEEGEEEVVRVNALDASEGLSVSDLGWSVNGSWLVVGLCGLHTDWCSHVATAPVWKVGGGQVKPEPTLVIDAPACVTKVAMHPTDSHQIALGCYTGEVAVFSLEDGHEVAGSGGLQQEDHQPVHGLAWLDKARILAAGGDGRLIIWGLDLRSVELTLLKVFLVSAEHLPRSLRVSRQCEVGTRCVALSQEDPSTAILGTEAGVIVVVNLESLVEIPGEEGVLDPVEGVYPAHAAPITDIKLSPYDNQLVATTGEDLLLTVVSLLQPHSPVLSYQLENPITALDWSPSNPSLLAGATNNNTVLLFELLQARTGPLLQVKASDKSIPIPLTSCAFSSKDGARLVAGDGYGRLYFWKLPNNLSSASIQHKNMFQTLVFISN